MRNPIEVRALHKFCALYTYVIHTSILVSRINVSGSQSWKSYFTFVSLSSFLSFFPFAYARPRFRLDLWGLSGNQRGSILIRIFQRDKSNRTNWTRKCSYIFPYLRLRNRFRITSNKLGHAVFPPYLFTCLPEFPSLKLNKSVSPFFRSVNTSTWIVNCETPLRGRHAHPPALQSLIPHVRCFSSPTCVKIFRLFT